MLRGDHPLLTQRLAGPTSMILPRSYCVHDRVSDTSQLGAAPGSQLARKSESSQMLRNMRNAARPAPLLLLACAPTCSQDQASSTHYTWMHLCACEYVIGA